MYYVLTLINESNKIFQKKKKKLKKIKINKIKSNTKNRSHLK